eukprot:gene1711-biopygen11070
MHPTGVLCYFLSISSTPVALKLKSIPLTIDFGDKLKAEFGGEVATKTGPVVGAAVVGAAVAFAAVVGAAVAFVAVVGAAVAFAAVVGAAVAFAAVVGATVVDAAVVGATVVGATVAGAAVVGVTGAVVGRVVGASVWIVGSVKKTLMSQVWPVSIMY